MDYKVVLGGTSVAIAIISYIPYIRDMLIRKSHPHAFSWLTWSSLAAINFSVQVSGKGGAGSWTWGVGAIEAMVVFTLCFKYGEKDIRLVDWLCIGGAAAALLLWALTNGPLLSVILISLVSGLGGFLPTFRKSYNHPEEETITIYVLSAIELVLSLFALQTFTLTNAFFTCISAVFSGTLVIFLLVRRRQVLNIATT